MRFEWDKEKNQSNFTKHGVDFDYASRIFEGMIVSWPDLRRDYGEARSHTIGRVDSTVILAVIHTDRSGHIRMISARLADREERRIYEAAIYKTTHN